MDTPTDLTMAGSARRRGTLPSVSLKPAGQIVDATYSLWLATVACVLMSTICLSVVVAIYILDTAVTFRGGAPLFAPDTYMRMLELVVLFGAVAVVAHFLRMRMEAIRRASILVPLPYRVVVTPPGGDTVSKFECSCTVTLALDHDRPLAEIKLKSDLLRQVLENAFVVAVSDPVIRFSKLKMEQTMKVAAHHVLGDGVSAVMLSDIRQRRVHAQRAEPTADHQIDGDLPADGAPAL